MLAPLQSGILTISLPTCQFNPQRIAIIRCDHLGDLVLTTPLMRALSLAGHTVEMIVPEGIAPILEHNPHITAILPLETLSPDFPADWFGLASQLRARKYNAILLPHARPKRLLLAALASGVPRRLAMWAGLPGRLLGHTCLRSGLPAKPRPFSRIMLDFAVALGIPDDGLRPDVFLTNEEITTATHRLAQELPGCRTVIGIHPGCAGNTCNLPATAYAGLARELLARPNLGLVLTGSPSESSILNSWSGGVLNSPRVWNSIGKLSLRELAAVIDRLDLYVVPSTGPLHLASARGIATLTPFCPRSPLSAEIWGNRGGTALVESPMESVCAARVAAGHCNFRGEITSSCLAARALAYLDSRPRSQ